MAKKGRRAPFAETLRELRAEPPAQSSEPYVVHFTKTAEDEYLAFRERSLRAEARGDTSNHHCSVFRVVEEAVRKLIPANATNPRYRLHKPLDGLYRFTKGRLRIVWTVHQSKPELLIMYLSEDLRKEGDARDPYAVLNAMAKAGYLTAIIDDWRKALDTPPDAPIH